MPFCPPTSSARRCSTSLALASVLVATTVACASGDADTDSDDIAATLATTTRSDPDGTPSSEPDEITSGGVVEGIGAEELGDGVVLEMSLAADGGPFDPDLDTVFNVVVDVDGLESDAGLEVEYELDLITASVTGDTTVLLEPDDEPGPVRVLLNRDVGAPALGAYTLMYRGAVFAVDGSFEYPFERVVRFVATEEGPAPVEEIELVGGALTVELSRRWAGNSPVSSFSRTLEPSLLDRRSEPPEVSDFEWSDTEVLVDLVTREGRTVTVRRLLHPLFVDDLDTLATALPDAFDAGEFADPVPVEVGGLAGRRVVRTVRDTTMTIDLLAAPAEVFIVQSTHGDELDHADEVAAVRDSLRFHPAEFDLLTHAVDHEVWLEVDGERYFSISTDVPADWRTDTEAPGVVAAPEGDRRVIRQSFPVGDATLEQFVEDVIDGSVPEGADAVVETDERGGLQAATVVVTGDPNGDAAIVILTDGSTFEVTTVRDDPARPDPELIAAIAASVRPVGPPSTS